MQDAAHIMLTYEGAPLSFLSVPGAKDVGVEVHSMSKGFHMIGWRLGWVCGHERIVQAFADVKDNSDSGQFMAIQKAGAAALDDAAIPRAGARKSTSAAAASWSTCSSAAVSIARCRAGRTFIYAKSPKGIAGGPKFETAEAASQYLITEHSICTVPWDDAGAYLRFSVTYEARRRSGRRRADGGDRRAAGKDPAGVLRRFGNEAAPLTRLGSDAARRCEPPSPTRGEG